jgi:lipopolysaccharide heptosyltransferase II
VVRFSSLGDLVLLTPLLRALRRQHPRAHLTVVTKAAFAPLFSHNPRVNEVIGWEPGAPLGALARRLRGAGFTHRLDLHGSLRSRALRLLVGGQWTGYPKHRLARTVLIRTKRDRYRDRRPVAERYFDAARALAPAPDGDPPELFLAAASVRGADRFLGGRALGQHRTLIALAPGAAHATKRWPERHWATLIGALIETRHDVVLVGGADDRALTERLARLGGPHAASAAGQVDVQGTAALLRRSRAAVAGDTGVSHLATAVGTPVVTLFGPTVRAFGFAPYAARATVLERDLPCRPCSAKGGPRCPLGHHRCLEEIEPAAVADALRRFPQ